MVREQIGDATLYLGDCLEIIPTLTKADVVITDPPYGVGISLGVQGKASGSDGGMWRGVKITGDESTKVRDSALALLCDIPFAVFGSHKLPPPDGTAATLVWEKGEHTGAGNLALPWKPNFEMVFIGGSNWFGKRGGSVLRYLAVAGCVGASNDGVRHHPTEKPVGLMQHFLSRCAGAVLDPFMGSGTTGVACANLGRKFTGIEIEPKYFEIACERITNAYRQQRLFA